MNTVILGAGMAGLAAAHKTKSPIYEASDNPGGLCRTYQLGDYLFERYAGHWMFGSGEAIDFVKKFTGFNEYEAKAGVYFHKIYQYPIQRELSSAEEYFPGSIKDWLLNKFGNDMCRMFFWPFNEKYTAGLYNNVIQDDSAKTPQGAAKTHCETFIYPALGTSYLVDRMADGLEINYGKKAVSIDINNRTIMFSDGSKVPYQRLISTIPLTQILYMVGLKPEGLLHTSTLVVNIGATKGKNFTDHHWLYFPHSESGFHRVQFYSNVSSLFAPSDRVSLCVEKAYFENNYDRMTIPYLICEELKKLCIIDRVEVIDTNWIDCAYTWVQEKNNREWAIEKLKEYGIYSIGRYGSWRFTGMAGAIQQGLSV